MACNVKGTRILYGDIEIVDVLSVSHHFETEYDESRVDPIGIRATVNFHGVLHTSDATTVTHGTRVNWGLPANTGLAPGLAATIEQWLTPRQRFQMYIDDDVFIDVRSGAVEECNATAAASSPTDKTQEISHGPRTKITIKSIAGGYSARCDFSVEFVVPMKCNNELRDWLNMRWWVADDIDCGSWMTRRVYQGQIRVRNKHVPMHLLARSIAFPPLAAGFRRDSVAYHESSDGLTLKFTIVDQEVHAAAPFPATKWGGTYAVDFGPEGYTCQLHLNFWLKAPRDVPKVTLLQLAARIMESKINYSAMRITNANKEGSFYLSQAKWEEKLEDNEVRASFTAMVTAPNRTLSTVPSVGKEVFNLGKYLDPEVSDIPDSGVSLPQYEGRGWQVYSPTRNFVPKWPNTLKQLFICQLQNPCCPQSLPYTESPPPVEETAAADRYATREPRILDPRIEGGEEHYSDDHNDAQYQDYRITNEYELDTGERAFPQSGDGSDSTVALAQLHNEVVIRKIHVSAKRIDATPVLPEPTRTWQDHNGITYTLKRYRYEPSQAVPSADGRNKIVQSEATYYYYMDRLPKLSEGESYSIGVNPVLRSDQLVPGDWAIEDLTVATSSGFKNPSQIFGNMGVG